MGIELTSARLKELLHYDAHTLEFLLGKLEEASAAYQAAAEKLHTHRPET